MIDNVSVSLELANKNKELYLNKLNMDLDNNANLLNSTITNNISVLGQELIKALISILDTPDIDRITKIVNDFFNGYREEIKTILTNRYTELKEKKELDDYLSYINSNLIESIKNYYLNNCSQIISKIKTDDDFIDERIDDYIENIFFNKFIKRIEECIKDANNLLINSYNESLARYKLMNEKTTIGK